MNALFIQITQIADSLNKTVAGAASLPVQPSASPATLLDIIMKGGVIMIPIALLSIIAAYVFFERYFSIRRHVSSDVNFMGNIRDFVVNGNTESALTLCRHTDKPVARMLEKGISRLGKPIKEIEESIEIAGKFEVYEMEKNIQILAVIAGIAPMFGFLGTIIGVIKIFYNISMTSDVSIGTVSAGLYTKMVSSASGLIVGIVAYIAYHWLNTILNKAVHQLEWNAMNFIDLLQSPAK
ncbi:MAG: MotA/TolQ/ExbB proton channel family protein [Bacteroidota bacterium]|nr:MotA/TolQ/ExbB proton channel family protein [Bacteroidota bacterium]